MESGRPERPKFEMMEPPRVCEGRKYHEGEWQEVREDQGMESHTTEQDTQV